MKNIIIITENNYLALGLISSFPKGVQFSVRVWNKSIKQLKYINSFDVIFFDIKHTPQGICFEMLKKRKAISKLILVNSGMVDINKGFLLKCYEDAYVLSKGSAREFVVSYLSNPDFFDLEERINLNSCCNRCRYPQLTYSQYIIIMSIRNGVSVNQIANSLNVSPKTVFAHIAGIKAKFNIRNIQGVFFLSSNFIQLDGPVKMI